MLKLLPWVDNGFFQGRKSWSGQDRLMQGLTEIIFLFIAFCLKIFLCFWMLRIKIYYVNVVQR